MTQETSVTEFRLARNVVGSAGSLSGKEGLS